MPSIATGDCHCRVGEKLLGKYFLLDCMIKIILRNFKIIFDSDKVWKYNPFSPFGPTVETAGAERFLTDLPENLPSQDVPSLFSYTQEDGLYPSAEFLSLEETMVEIETKWNDILPFLLDYNNTISDESLRPEIAQKIKTFYYGNNTGSADAKNGIIEVRQSSELIKFILWSIRCRISFLR